jgi:hypothetical protein
MKRARVGRPKAEKVALLTPKRPGAEPTSESTPATPEEGVLLVKAFVRISNPTVRAAIIDWVSEQAVYR